MQKKYIKINKKKDSGFTIIETMIAISIFLIVVMVGMGALLNTSLIHTKSQDMRSIMDNLSFIMEDMSRNLRTGYNYHCIDDGILTSTVPHSCISGGKGISFKSADPTGGQWVYFIGTYNGTPGIFRSVDGAISFVQLTSKEVVIDPSSSFLVTGAESGDNLQPFVTIKLIGTITSTKNNTVTPFSLQTSVSQRSLDR